MSEYSIPVRTDYGPLEVAVTRCDDCGAESATSLLINWHKLSPNSTIPVMTMSSNPHPLDFCSLACLASAVKQMTGE